MIHSFHGLEPDHAGQEGISLVTGNTDLIGDDGMSRLEPLSSSLTLATGAVSEFKGAALKKITTRIRSGSLIVMIALLFWNPLRAYGQVTVAFFEMVDAQGRLIQYEVGSRFAHVALLVGDYWLHAYPYYGVQIVPDFSGIAYHSVVFLHHPEYPMPSWPEIEAQFNKRFSLITTWEDPDNTYCSKMIGQLLRLEPEPMIFDAPMWRELPESTYRQLLRYEGLPGLSPDDVFRRLVERGFR